MFPPKADAGMRLRILEEIDRQVKELPGGWCYRMDVSTSHSGHVLLINRDGFVPHVRIRPWNETPKLPGHHMGYLLHYPPRTSFHTPKQVPFNAFAKMHGLGACKEAFWQFAKQKMGYEASCKPLWMWQGWLELFEHDDLLNTQADALV